MHPNLPCPNPACTHTFSPDSVQGTSSLVCPKCGTVFRFSSAPAASARSSVAAKKPVASKTPPLSKPAVPIAQPVAVPAVPPAPRTGEDKDGAANFDFNSTSDRATPPSRRKARRGRHRLVGWILTLLIGIFVPGLAVWGGMWVLYFLKSERTGDDTGPATEVPYNARFSWPAKPWARDKDIQRRFNVHIGMKSPEHDNRMALLFKDYKDRLPSDAEMLDEAVGKLRAYFKGLEWEPQSKDVQLRLAGHSAQVLQFQGDDSDFVTFNGECYMLAFRGYGYWFFTWAPLGELERDGESIRAEWARLRNGFGLLDERKGWKAKPREALMVSGKKAKYRLAYLKGLWTREAAEDEEPQIDLLLRGQEPDPERRPLAGKDATVQVLVLSQKTDLASATAAALAYVKQREMKLYERTVWEPIRDKHGEIDRDAPIGAEPGHLTKLHAKCTEDLERFLSIAVVNRPDGVVVLVGDCLWERRDFWDQEFTALFKTFKVP
jgi:hypothetical protein